MAVWSPGLNANGNSQLGSIALEKLAKSDELVDLRAAIALVCCAFRYKKTALSQWKRGLFRYQSLPRSEGLEEALALPPAGLLGLRLLVIRRRLTKRSAPAAFRSSLSCDATRAGGGFSSSAAVGSAAIGAVSGAIAIGSAAGCFGRGFTRRGFGCRGGFRLRFLRLGGAARLLRLRRGQPLRQPAPLRSTTGSTVSTGLDCCVGRSFSFAFGCRLRRPCGCACHRACRAGASCARPPRRQFPALQWPRLLRQRPLRWPSLSHRLRPASATAVATCAASIASAGLLRRVRDRAHGRVRHGAGAGACACGRDGDRLLRCAVRGGQGARQPRRRLPLPPRRSRLRPALPARHKEWQEAEPLQSSRRAFRRSRHGRSHNAARRPSRPFRG